MRNDSNTSQEEDRSVPGADSPVLSQGGSPAETVDGTAHRSGSDQRGLDRRNATTPRFSRWTFTGGRRRSVRRGEEREGSFVDQHGLRLMLLILWIALMNVGDSYFTLVHLQDGGVEMNPVAQGLLNLGRFPFVFLKSLLIGFALVVLAIHKNFFLARVGVFISAASYTLLVLYHLFLFRVN